MSTLVCFDHTNSTPSFPALYIPHALDPSGIYLCSTYDAWLFTVLWTLIIYAALFLAAAGYALLVQASVHVGSPAIKQDSNAEPRSKETPQSASIIPDVLPDIRTVHGGLIDGVGRNWRVASVIGAGYVVVGGVEAVVAGSVVGAILGTVYRAGDYRLSTWVPLVWAVINGVFLVLSSFSIQERLL